MAAVLFKQTLLFIIFLFLISFFIPSAAQTCRSYSFSSNLVYNSCIDLPVLNSFLHWNYTSSSGTVHIVYRKTNTNSLRWISWGINLDSPRMVGAQTLVAYQASNGVMRAYSSPINSYKTQLQPGNLTFPVSSISAEFLNNEMIIFATLQLPNNITSVNQLWQDGPLMNGDVPGRHEMSAEHILSRKTLDLLSGQTTTTIGAPTTTPPLGGRDSTINSRITYRNIHGVLSALSWGIMMPVGALVARYLKVFKSVRSLWFYLHIFIQSSAYVVGVAGWVMGLILGSQSQSLGIQHDAHRNIGIILFSLGTFQVFALVLRPKPDHKYRSYWNVYHHITGYIVIILSVVNVYKGIDILDPEKKWKTFYTAFIITLAIITVVVESLTWILTWLRNWTTKKAEATDANGTTKTLPI